ncbi:hypothetical protein EIP86_005586 [Pleurotus ostreatoroseus]|nr:hypothetical protein EIP86_005586 [Pleurotus ostreatoroseus]
MAIFRSILSTNKWRYEEPTPTKAKPPETPVRQKSTTKPTFQASNAAFKKETVYEEVYPTIKPVSDDVFFEGILPPLPRNLKLDSAIKTLKKIGIITDGRLTSFPQNPSKLEGVENVVFQRLEETVADIVQAVKGKSRKPTKKFVCNPDGVPISLNRTNQSRPDGYLLTLDSGNEVQWIKIAIPAEYKKFLLSDKRHDNDLKTIWSIYHCMCEDPRKRFIISFTIEDNMMRLWFCNRELFVVSNAFDFITEYRKTVHFFISVMFAKDHQLGWDPTMVPYRKSDKRFKILVRDQNNKVSWYVTEALLSDMGVESLFGRATRVWSARKLDSKEEPIGPLVVLKDSWVDDDRVREGDIYRQIQQHPETRQYLLEVVCSGDVYLKEAKEWDHTRIQALKEAILPRMGRTMNGRFINTTNNVPSGSRLPKATVSEDEPSSSATQPIEASDNPQFRYNPLHDFESLWWMGVNSVVDKEIHDGDMVLKVSDEQRAWADKLFYDNHSDLGRLDVFSKRPTFQQIVESLDPSIRRIGKSLESLRNTLHVAYQLVEKDLSKAFDMSLAEEVSSNVNELFVKLADSIKDRSLTLHRIPPPSASRKRKEIDEDTASDGSVSESDALVSASPRPTKKAHIG